MALLAAGATALLIDRDGPEALDPAAGPELAATAAIAAESPSIAVMPFKLLSDRPEDRYARDGLADEIITELARHDALFVVAWDTVQHFQSNDLDIDDLGVRIVLDGSLRRVDDRHLRITARLTDTATRATLWSSDFERIARTGDLPAVEAEIVGQIVTAVAASFELALDRDGAEGNPEITARQDSYECFLMALAYGRRPNPGDHATTRDCLERTVTADPHFGKAWAALSFSYIDEVRFGFNRAGPSDEALRRAAWMAEHAVALAPRSELAQRALFNAYYLLGRAADFELAGETALELYPRSSLVLADLGMKFAIGGQWERGLALVREAIRLNPAYPDWYRFPFFFDHFRKGRDQEALTHALLIDLPDYPMTHLCLAAVYGELGLEAEAAAALDRLLALLPDLPDTRAAYLARWQLDPPLAARLTEGLLKAGLPDPDGS